MDAMAFHAGLFYMFELQKWNTIAVQAPLWKTIPGWGYFKSSKKRFQIFTEYRFFPVVTMAEKITTLGATKDLTKECQ